jgi:hypothetical protein
MPDPALAAALSASARAENLATAALAAMSGSPPRDGHVVLASALRETLAVLGALRPTSGLIEEVWDEAYAAGRDAEAADRRDRLRLVAN